MFFLNRPIAVLCKVLGRDARRYLNARLSNDIAKIPPGGRVKAAMLTAQGRTEGIFTIACTGADEFFLAADAGEQEVLLSALKRFIVTDLVQIVPLEGYQLIHVTEGAAESAFAVHGNLLLKEGDACAFQDEVVVMRTRRSFQPGFDYIAPPIAARKIIQRLRECELHSLNENEQTYLRIEANIPSYPEELNEHTLAVEAFRDDLMSRNKGCYVGQEVVEKALSHGKVNRTVVRLRVAGRDPLSTGELVKASETGQVIGIITSSALGETSADVLCFARIRSELASKRMPLVVAGAAAEIIQ